MPFLIILISFLWLAGTVKSILFWLYLWQLKDYHIGRFIDHFQTAKGKRIIFLYVTQFMFWRMKKPVFTAKMILLCILAISISALYFVLTHTVMTLVLYNLLVPIIVSALVLLVQPFFVTARNRILKKARKKMAQFPNLVVIGITGSYGKTSTKEFLQTILAEKFKVLATPEHKNSEIGIAQTILQELNARHEIFIVEMGAYNKGGIKLLCDMVKPRIGVVTGVNEQHLATFGSLENLLSAEGGQELLASLPKSGTLMVNGENKYCLDLYKNAKIDKKIYAINKDKINTDIWTEELSVKPECLDFVAVDREKHAVHMVVDVLGRQHAQNLLGTMLVARELGMSFEEIASAAKNISQAQGGMTLKNGAHGIKVIDSSYSANPDGVMADLDYLKVFTGKRVIVMPCLIELGAKSIEAHIQIGKKIAEVADLAIITTRDKFEEIRNGAIINGLSPEKVLFIENQKEIFNVLTTFCGMGDTVLLEGGRPSEVIKLLKLSS